MRRRLFLLTLALVVALPLLLAASPPEPSAPKLRAGVALVDITPPNGGTMLGYVRPDIPTVGVHTRLTGRALVLDDGQQKVALLATDLAFALDKESLVARVQDLGFDHGTVLYTGTHTHAGPEGLDDWQLEQLADAIREADAALQPAVAAWGTATVDDVNRNRSVEAHLANHGQDLFYGQGHEGDDPDGHEHTRDTTLRLLRVDTAEGPLAAWTNFPVHLTTVTPANNLWDADLAGTAMHHLAQAVGRATDTDGFVGLWTNGASGDIQPTFDAWNPQVLVDLHGRRVAAGAFHAWQHAADGLTSRFDVDTRWTRRCYCGQEVESGKSVSDTAVFGVPFLGGSEDGASIFHEPLATEGRRRPAALADPVHGQKIIAAPSDTPVLDVHEATPEITVIRLGDRLLLASPGEPSVEMGRRFAAAVEPVLPDGVTDVMNVGLSNDYLGYLVTPEEYEMQHYEGGHTVFGTWTSLLVRNAFVELTASLAAGAEAPSPDAPGGLGGTEPGQSPLGDSGAAGELVAAPKDTVSRYDVVELRWDGGEGGIDRPVGTSFVRLEREVAPDTFVGVDSDLGVNTVWAADGTAYSARYDVPGDIPTGTYRFRISSGSYQLLSDRFVIAPSEGLIPLGVERIGERIVFRAQNPRPDAETTVAWRPVQPQGGQVRFVAGGRERIARWDAALGAWAAPAQGLRAGDPVTIVDGGLTDAHGNRSGAAVWLEVGTIADADWPDHIGVGGGRAPGPGGQGSFPP